LREKERLQDWNRKVFEQTKIQRKFFQLFALVAATGKKSSRQLSQAMFHLHEKIFFKKYFSKIIKNIRQHQGKTPGLEQMI
jgi:hypothetical protein